MIDFEESLDMKRFRKMYLTVAALPMVLVVLTGTLWLISANGWDSAPIDVTSAHLPMFGFLAFISLPLTFVFRSAILRRTGPFHADGHGFKPAQEYRGEDAAVLRITQAAIIGMFPRPSQVREWYAQQTASTTHVSVPL